MVLLVVDQNEINLDLCRRMLSPIFDSAILARNGVEALELLSSHRVDFILANLEMPMIDGFQLAKIIRSCDGGRLRCDPQTTPIVILGSIDERHLSQIPPDISGYLQIPVDKNTLIQKIREHLYAN